MDRGAVRSFAAPGDRAASIYSHFSEQFKHHVHLRLLF